MRKREEKEFGKGVGRARALHVCGTAVYRVVRKYCCGLDRIARVLV